MLTAIAAAETFIQMIFFREYNKAFLIVIKIHSFCKLIVHVICNVSKDQKVQYVQEVYSNSHQSNKTQSSSPLGEIKGAFPNPKQLGFINVQSLSVTFAIHHPYLQLLQAKKNEDKRFCCFRLYPDFHNGF